VTRTPPPNATPPEVREKIAVMLRAGASNAAITAETGRSPSVIKDVAGEIGVFRGPRGRLVTAEEAADLAKRTGRPMEPATVTEMLRQAGEGVSPPELAKRFGVSVETVRTHLRAEGWTMAGPLGSHNNKWLPPGSPTPVKSEQAPKPTPAPSNGVPKADRLKPTIDADSVEAALRAMSPNPTNHNWLAVELTEQLVGKNASQARVRAAVEQVRNVLKGDSRFVREKAGYWRLAADDEPLTAYEESHKIRLLRLVIDRGPFANEHELTVLLNRTPEIRLSGHESIHILHSLRKQGKVSFHHSPDGPNGAKVTRITGTPNGSAYVRSLGVKPKQNEKEPDNGPYAGAAHNGFVAAAIKKAQQPVVPAPEPAPEVVARPLAPEPNPWLEPAPGPAITAGQVVAVADEAKGQSRKWPLLAELRAKEAGRLKAQAKAEKYLAAAALLEDDEADRLMVESLVGAANALAEGNTLSRVEAEYLAYAEEAERG
jgi:hypothetical protein